MSLLFQPRRDFLKTTLAGAAAVATPYVFTSHSSAQDQDAAAQDAAQPEKRDKMDIGVIGCGGMGSENIHVAKDLLNVVAVADVDSEHANAFNQRFAGGKAAVMEDYRAMLDSDVPVILIATPDHWHTKALVEAMLAGKDVYCEKPLTLTIDEGKLIRKVQKETGRIVQVGTQQRSQFNLFTKAMAIIAEGRLGRIHQVQAAINGARDSPPIPVAKVPTHLDWDRWLGPAPLVDYRRLSQEGQRTYTNCHHEFRWWYEYSGGKLTDWGAHSVDICVWALHLNGQTAGPTAISGTAKHPVQFRHGVPLESDRYNTATNFHFKVDYPGGTELLIRDDTDDGVLITGEKGRIFVNRGKLTGKPVEDLVDNPLPEGAISKVYKGAPIKYNERLAHWANFLYSVRECKEPISDVHSHMKMLNVCHLAAISARLGRSLQWDDAIEEIVGDDLANSMLARPYREGYEIEMG